MLFLDDDCDPSLRLIVPASSRRIIRVLAAVVGCAASVHCATDSAPTPELPKTVATCESCHKQIVESFVRTAHFKTSSEANVHSVKGHFNDGQNVLRTHLSAVYFTMSRRADGLYQEGVDSTRRTVNSARIDIVVGSGRRGQTFLYWQDHLLYQLPVSYLSATDSWINSPGYPDGRVDFGRVIVPRCLECHSTSFTVVRTTTGPVYGATYELGVTCAKCHGDGTLHAATAAQNPAGAATTIRNPARFDRERRMDNCALCHSGNRPLRAAPFSYQPGDDLSRFLAPDPNAAATIPDVHGNQVSLLRLSKCFRSSPEMSCSTCHNVHQTQRDVTALAQNCLKCHQVATHPKAAQIGDRMMSKCVDCHMPVSRSNALQINTASETGGFSIRSHRIAIYPDVAAREMGPGRTH